jgi:type IV secretory pathway VirJ component
MSVMKPVLIYSVIVVLSFNCFADSSIFQIPINQVHSHQDTALPFLAVEWTGDAGYKVTDREICNSFSRHGIPVVSINSFRYFLKRRDPDSVSEDCSRLIQHFGAQWNRNKIILIGYSFGADALPFIYNRLPAEIKKTVSLLVVISPSFKADFHFHLLSWFNHAAKDALPFVPELKNVTGTKVLCVYGKQDRASSGPDIEKEKIAKVISFDTGHRMGHNGDRIINEILAMIQ